ncbi:hypothetical protein ACFOZ7_16710 [Natribaculum luteum]|uniref:Death domain-associated protein n=1 Tax=Natribaculum luteum TaxID=1586232 RepID=A0ABD5P3N6_9EURY|nr:hypothetical protein [Natribaculum luteum]
MADSDRGRESDDERSEEEGEEQGQYGGTQDHELTGVEGDSDDDS